MTNEQKEARFIAALVAELGPEEAAAELKRIRAAEQRAAELARRLDA